MWVVGYGSTLSIGSLAQTDRSFANSPLLPVRIEGWERLFCVPSKTWGGKVLGVRTAPSPSWFNGVLIHVPDEAALERFDRREGNYERVQLPSEAVNPYYQLEDREQERVRQEPIYLYVPREERVSFDGSLSMGYLRVCASGAHNFGDDFFWEFLETTLLGAGPNALAAVRGLPKFREVLQLYLG